MNPSASKILLVDDRPENLLALEAVLEPLGRTLVKAASGEEALKRLLVDDFAVILLDVQMPGLDGFETASYVKRLERTRHIPIIFLTAINTEARHVFRGYESGAVDYVVKPFDPTVLRSKVAVFVDLHETTAALRASEERFRRAFEDAPIGVGIVTADGRWAEVNRALAELAGRDPGELVGRPADDLAHPDEPGRLSEDVAELVAGRAETISAERRFRSADGAERAVLLSASLVRDAVRRPVHALVMVNDVTAHRAAEQRAAALAIERAAQREAAALHARLENALLPTLALADSALATTTRYRAGENRLLLGGDFVDAIDCPDGRVAMIIGDVSGHGPEAAGLGAGLRAAWRALVLAGLPDERLVPALHDVLAREGRSHETFVTVCCCWLDKARRSLATVLAGHPAPLLMTDRVREQEAVAGPPLGVAGGPWPRAETELAPDWAILLYTDGLVEGRDGVGDGRFGVGRLGEALADMDACQRRAGPELLDALLERVTAANGGDLGDDVAMLFMAHTGTPPLADGTGDHADGAGLSLRLPAEPSSVPHARSAVGELCDRLGVSRAIRADACLAVTEACANVVMHAYRDDTVADQVLEVLAWPEGGSLRIVVRDFGGGVRPRDDSPGVGLGLPLISSLAAEVAVKGPPEHRCTEVAMLFAAASQNGA